MEFKIVFIYKRNFLREQCLTRKLLGSSHFSCIKYGSRPCSLSLIFSFGNGGYNLVYYVHVLHMCNIYKIHIQFHCMFLAFLKYYVYVYNIFFFCILRMYYAESAVDILRIVKWFRRYYYYFVKISFSYGIFPLKQTDIVKPIFLFYFSENIHNS